MKATSKSAEVSAVKFPELNEQSFLLWIHDRLINVHGENECYDYMHILRGIIAKYDIEPKESEKQKLTMKHLDLYRAAINEIDDFFEYANESDSDKKKVREILNKLTVGLMFSVGDITPPVTESK